MKKLVITDEELDRRLDAMPDDVANVYEGTETAKFLFSLGKLHGLADEKISDVARATGYVLLGFIQTDEFPNQVRAVVGDQAKADTLAKEISQKVFLPARASLLKLSTRTAPPLPAPPKPPTLQPRPIPPSPPHAVSRVAPPPPPPRPIVPPVWPAPVVPSKPILMPTPAPPVTEAEADLALEKILAGLPHELRSAVRNVPLRRIIYTLGREHRLTIEEIGQLADGVIQFIAGKIHRETLLGTLTKLLKGDRTKAAAAADELNAKVFGPIREAMKRATLPPPPAGSMKQEAGSMEPPKPKVSEPLIIYPLPMAPKAPPPSAGIRNLESRIMDREAPASTPHIDKPPLPSGAPPVPTAPSGPISGPPPALPVYEELRERAQKEFADFERAKPPASPPEKAPLKPPQPLAVSRVEPPPAKPLGPDPYRESVE